MSALLTLAAARTALWQYGSDVPLSTATQPQKDAFAAKLNQVCEELLLRGKPRTTMRRVTIPIYDGVITLPRHLLSCSGVKLLSSADDQCGNPLLLYSAFHEFHNGPCAACDCDGGAYPLTQLAQTFRDPASGFKLYVPGLGNDLDITEMTLIGGTDVDGNEFHDSVVLDLSDGSDLTIRVYGTLPQIQKPVTINPVNLYSVKDGVTTLIAAYAPGETVPAYTRYQVTDTDSTAPACIAQCKLAFVPVVADTDIIYPSVIRAIKSGLKAVQREDKEEPEAAAKWWAAAQEALDMDRQQIDGDTFTEFSVLRGVGFADFQSVI